MSASNKNFASDNVVGASPEILSAIAAANGGAQSSYGADEYSQRVERRLREIFETDLDVLCVATGSAANALSLAAMTPAWGGVLCHEESHINNDECGAPEFYSGGKLLALGGAAAKLDPAALRTHSLAKIGDVHCTQPTCVSVSQVTELGSVYSLDALRAIGSVCRERKFRLHMDGARFANALAALGCSPAEMTWKAGVDVLSFGATKNGALAAEAIVVFDRTLTAELAYRRKRGGHLLSKMRLIAAQMDAYLTDDLWLRNARHANAMARRLADGLRGVAGVVVHDDCDANILFCTLPPGMNEALHAQGFHFYGDRWAPGVVRIVTSFATAEADVDAFIAAARSVGFA
ncbi:MAG: low specificity L-threonine aldolase [Rudaea sp.]|uniref:threonine aldolase family protein n=1 Tax=unclassified Rudaea TaxID=2627037 RepID=UPI0010F73700|nr:MULTISPECIES: low specificity L-threonine aldolase [unclassified Rudaea]MBN8887947.1 low specificity L-threonine aldolase [Rudaea sp.]MBR0343746.1 low specificity L-threonine aldolase [Rudaea sp.]